MPRAAPSWRPMARISRGRGDRPVLGAVMRTLSPALAALGLRLIGAVLPQVRLGLRSLRRRLRPADHPPVGRTLWGEPPGGALPTRRTRRRAQAPGSLMTAKDISCGERLSGAPCHDFP